MEEAIQHNGDTDFAGSLARLHELVGMLGYPVLLKEVGPRDRSQGRRRIAAVFR